MANPRTSIPIPIRNNLSVTISCEDPATDTGPYLPYAPRPKLTGTGYYGSIVKEWMEKPAPTNEAKQKNYTTLLSAATSGSGYAVKFHSDYTRVLEDALSEYVVAKTSQIMFYMGALDVSTVVNLTNGGKLDVWAAGFASPPAGPGAYFRITRSPVPPTAGATASQLSTHTWEQQRPVKIWLKEEVNAVEVLPGNSVVVNSNGEFELFGANDAKIIGGEYSTNVHGGVFVSQDAASEVYTLTLNPEWMGTRISSEILTSANTLSTNAKTLSTNISTNVSALASTTSSDATALSTSLSTNAASLASRVSTDADSLSTSVATKANTLSTDVSRNASTLAATVSSDASSLSTSVSTNLSTQLSATAATVSSDATALSTSVSTSAASLASKVSSDASSLSTSVAQNLSTQLSSSVATVSSDASALSSSVSTSAASLAATVSSDASSLSTSVYSRASELSTSVSTSISSSSSSAVSTSLSSAHVISSNVSTQASALAATVSSDATSLSTNVRTTITNHISTERSTALSNDVYLQQQVTRIAESFNSTTRSTIERMQIVEAFIATTEQFVQQTSDNVVLNFSSSFKPYPVAGVSVLGGLSADIVDGIISGIDFMAAS